MKSLKLILLFISLAALGHADTFDSRAFTPATWPGRVPPELARDLRPMGATLLTAMRAGDDAALAAAKAKLTTALGPYLGAPEEKPVYGLPVDPAAPDAAALANRWSAAWRALGGRYGWELAALAQTAPGHGGKVPRLRVSQRQIRAFLHLSEIPGAPDAAAFRTAALAGLDYLVTTQSSTGVFGYPYEPGGSGLRQQATAVVQRGEAQGKKMLERGWVIDDLDNGDLNFDNGISGLTLLQGWTLTGEPRYLAAARRAGTWAASRLLCPNYNYNGFSGLLCARLYRATGETQWLDAARRIFRFGVLSGQLPNGRWFDQHNAKIQYHAILCAQTAEFLLALRAAPSPDAAEIAAVTVQLRAALDNVATELTTLGTNNAMEALSLEALVSGSFALGPDPLWDRALNVAVNYIAGSTFAVELAARSFPLPEPVATWLLYRAWRDGRATPSELSPRLAPPPAPGAVTREERVPMRDGVMLAARIVFPRDPGAQKFSVVLERTPYGRASRKPETFLRAGWVFVAQDLRGFGDSTGTRRPFTSDGPGPLADGADTVAWLKKQPWCNGQVAVGGASAGGITALAATASAPDEFTAFFPMVAPASMYGEAAYQGGVLRESVAIPWLTRHAPKVLADYLAHWRRDSFWDPTDFRLHADRVRTPGFHVSGWFDLYQQGTLDNFTVLQGRGNQRLIIGPWVHGAVSAHRLANPRFRDADAVDLPAELTAFLRAAFAGEPVATPVVRYYTMGAFGEAGAPGNTWRTADRWPVASTPTKFFLYPDGTLASTAPAAAAEKSYTFDPADPAPTLGGISETTPDKVGFLDQRPVEDRGDQLLFTTAVLDAPVELTGRLRAELTVSTDAADTDIVVRLTDVYPDGRSLLIADGIVRLSLRGDPSAISTVDKNHPYAVSVDLWSTSLIVNRGHRLRVAVTSSNWPRFERNPGTGAPHYDPAAPAIIARNTLHLGGAHLNALILPVVTP